jgi:hypothetical protein
MAVVDDVHARALQQVRGEAEAASQVPAWDGKEWVLGLTA